MERANTMSGLYPREETMKPSDIEEERASARKKVVGNTVNKEDEDSIQRLAQQLQQQQQQPEKQQQQRPHLSNNNNKNNNNNNNSNKSALHDQSLRSSHSLNSLTQGEVSPVDGAHREALTFSVSISASSIPINKTPLGGSHPSRRGSFFIGGGSVGGGSPGVGGSSQGAQLVPMHMQFMQQLGERNEVELGGDLEDHNLRILCTERDKIPANEKEKLEVFEELVEQTGQHTEEFCRKVQQHNEEYRKKAESIMLKAQNNPFLDT